MTPGVRTNGGQYREAVRGKDLGVQPEERCSRKALYHAQTWDTRVCIFSALTRFGQKVIVARNGLRERELCTQGH